MSFYKEMTQAYSVLSSLLISNSVIYAKLQTLQYRDDSFFFFEFPRCVKAGESRMIRRSLQIENSNQSSSVKQQKHTHSTIIHATDSNQFSLLKIAHLKNGHILQMAISF